MERTFARDVKPGKPVLVKGWVVKIRDLGNLKFFTLRDRTGTVQVTLKKGEVPEKLLNDAAEL
ncbi:MAG: OB-fold nucleic acid binding domain-containing protein, partial [Candidatus Aenigmatarchaeota archaeon]